MPPASTARVSLPDRYRVIRHLANGGMASVWEAHDDLLDRDVAVKVLAPHLGEDDDARRRFAREARAAAGLSTHPNVVTIYDVGEHGGRTYMVMELMRGGSLADRLRRGDQRSGDEREARGRIPHDDALRWLGEAAAGLDAAHDAGVVHRDIKPANLLLDERGRLGIGDFGIARVAETSAAQQLTATGQVLGTAAYISPEQALGEGATAASDRYALAVVAYELLTGDRPFRAENFAAQARAHVEDPPAPPSERSPSLSPAVDAVLLQGLAKDPADRWPTATEMVGRLDDALDSPPTEATRAMPATSKARRTPPPLPPRSEPLPVRRRRFGGAALLAGLAGLLLVAVAAAVLLSGGGDDNGNQTAGTPTPAKTAAPAKKKKAQKTPTPTPTATATATATATPTPTASATATTAPPSSGGVDLAKASQLQTAGFNAGNSGDFAKDLALSQQALKACGDTQRLSPCGYANYEIGRSLVELGRPSEAIPYLERRLAFGDSTGQVQTMLDRAKAEASGGSSGPGNGKGKDHKKG